MNKNIQVFFGETIGTFTLVFIGLFSVYASVIKEWFGLLIVSFFWIFGVFLGIFVSRKWAPSHLNPAVTLGFWINGENRTLYNRFFIFFGQIVGAFIASALLYILFKNQILFFEKINGIDRGETFSKSAMIFGEFYPNPNELNKVVSTKFAFFLEFFGTFLLMLVIFFVSKKFKSDNLKAIIIGLTVGILILFIAPYTQAGLNPFRDFIPRTVSYLLGWKYVWVREDFYPILVYVIAPFLGSSLAGLIFKMNQD